MDKTLETASTLASQLFSGVESVVNKYGATVVDTVLWVTRVEAINQLGQGFIALLVLGILYKIWKGAFKFYDDWEDHYLGPVVIGGCATLVVGLAALIFVIVNLLNIWLYVAVAKPELYLAKKAIDKVLEVGKK